MKIVLKEILIKDLVFGYVNNNEEGVSGYSGKLNIRPKYQREFVYKDKQRDSVIETVQNNFPLNVMYWVKNSDGTFEVLDGQQRTISICEYVAGNYSINEKYFHNLATDKQDEVKNYKLMVYFCEGKDSEKLDWFKTINIAGEKLTDQELRNAIYTGEWLTDAKRYFSKTGCAAYNIAGNYLTGSAIRQDYLETAVKWISNDHIEQYMAKHQHDLNTNELWLYFQNVICWVKLIFKNYRKEMKGVDWGDLYNNHKENLFDAKQLEIQVVKLMQDEDVTKKSGIYNFLVSGEEKHLSIRAFTDKMKREAYERQQGVCHRCLKQDHYEIHEMEADHITPWHIGGRTISENCKMLCKKCNREKSGK